MRQGFQKVPRMKANKRMTRRHFLKTTGRVVGGGAAMSMGFGCAPTTTATGRPTGPPEVKLAVIYPLSGPVGSAGKMSRNAIDLCVDYVNSKLPRSRAAGH